MNPLRTGVGIAVAVAAAAPLAAQSAVRLGDAVVALGERAGVSIGLADPGLASLRVGSPGTGSVETVLRGLLKGLPARAVQIDARTWTIVRAAPAPRSTQPEPAPAKPTVALRDDSDTTIVVTASKRAVGFGSYPGAVTITGDTIDIARRSARGSAALVAVLPQVSSTELGSGRNKLFVRGISDSSFNGPTQATVGQYLGEVRLNYNAPDPDLELYDVAAVEVLEGPQGTLYGSGSLGGIVRVVPNPVSLDRAEGALTAGASTTAHGAAGYDVAGMLNLPLFGDRAGVRAVGYSSSDGGYIDDIGRGRRDVNRTRIVGGRVALLAKLGDDWTLGAGGVIQTTNADDGQYAQRGLPPLTKSSVLPQRFDNDYGLGDIVLTGTIGELRLTSTLGLVHHDITTDYDFTPAGGAPRLLTQNNRIVLISNETRVTRSHDDGSGWLLGFSIVADVERLTRMLGPPAAQTEITGVRNRVTEGALFGEYGVRLTPALLLTAGGRLNFAHLSGRGLGGTAAPGQSDRTELRALPSVALSWRATPLVLVYGRYQVGYRPGGLSASDGGVDAGRFRADTLGSFELGARFAGLARHGWEAAVALSYAHWENIQSDLIDAGGLPLTANIGTGRILAAEARVAWQPAPGVSLDASLFYNESALTDPQPIAAAAKGEDLPNVSDIGARVAGHARIPLRDGLDLRLDGSVRYVGYSKLGLPPDLNIPQGGYADIALAARVGSERTGLTLSVDNAADTVGNRFALGDPFRVRARDETTPLRPRTIRLALDTRF